MRCPNCGYISFDYLDLCVKCRTELTGERQRLNLPEVRPNPISFQEIMEQMPIIAQQARKPEKEEATVKVQRPVMPKKPEIDLSQGLSLDISIPSDPKPLPGGQKSSLLETEEFKLALEGLEPDSPSGKKGN